MTHIENIPHILQHGITHPGSVNRNPGYVPIGDASVIGNRANHVIPNGKRLGDYIPFYFGGRMPMLYVVQKGFNGVEPTLAQNVVYCVTSVGQVLSNNINFVFTNGHALGDFSVFYSADNVNDIDTLIDNSAIKAKYWKDDKDLDLKRRKEAEFLIESDLPPNAILAYVVYNQQAQQLLLQIGVEAKKIRINADFYF